MVARKTYGAGISEKPVARTEQRHCGCGAPVDARKKRCWDCEARHAEARRTARKRRRKEQG